MTKTYYLLFFVVITLSSCSPKMISEINTLQPEQLEPLSLKPSCEVHNLRIDIIRNTETVQVNDSTTKTEDVPYHPLGFDLGNGLFFDLNENLSFRIDYLLGFNPEKDFTIKRSFHPFKKRHTKFFQFENDTMTYRYPPKKAEKERYIIEYHKDSIVWYYSNILSNYKFSYAITQNNDIWKYRGKRRVFDRIIKDGDNSYHLNKFIKTERYSMTQDTVYLEKDYVIVRSDNGSKIEILSHRRSGKHYHLYSIERDNAKLLIYTRRGFGKKIEYSNDRITLFVNNRELLRWNYIE
jgi:hypothetical protein